MIDNDDGMERNNDALCDIDLGVLEDDIDKGLNSIQNIEKSDETDALKVSEEFKRKERDSYIKIDSEFANFLQGFVINYNKKESQKLEFKASFFLDYNGRFFYIDVNSFFIGCYVGTTCRYGSYYFNVNYIN